MSGSKAAAPAARAKGGGVVQGTVVKGVSRTPEGQAATTAAKSVPKRGPQNISPGVRASQDRPITLGDRSGLAPDGTSWHTVILAEYLAVMLILFASEILGPVGAGTSTPTGAEAATAQTKTFSGILVRMTAASLFFFVLALAGQGRAGKVSAALGGLVTLGAVLNAGPVWTGIGRVFGPKSGQAADAGDGATEATDGNALSIIDGAGSGQATNDDAQQQLSN
jgi:hypothetical protein